MAARLPAVGGDDGDWGTILNDFLDVSHNADGSLQASALQQAGGVTSVNGKPATNGSVTLAAGDVSALGATAAAGGDLSGNYPNPTVAKVNGVTVSGTPGSGKALIATGSSAASWSAVGGTVDWIDVVTDYGADPTGTNDSSTAIQNAINALPVNGGTVYIPAGTYKMLSSVTITGTFVNLRGAGRWATQLNFSGTGDCVRIYNTDTTGKLTGGGIVDLTVDGTGSGAGSAGLHYGDMRAGELRVAVRNFSNTSSIGVHLDNQYSWTEECHGYIWLSNNTQNLVFDVSGNTTSTNSFGYSDFNVEILAKDNQDGLVLQNGALLYHSRVSVKGNFKGTSVANTSAAIRLTGTIPAGHPNAGSGSKIANSRFDFMAECSSANGSNAPQSIVFGTLSTNTLTGCTGILDFTFGSLAFAQSNYTPLSASGTFQYMGLVTGDHNLNQATSGLGQGTHWLIQGAIIYGASNLTTNNGTLLVDKGDFFQSTLSQSLTINMVGGGSTYNAPQRKTIIIIQAASGGPYTVTWPSVGSPSTANPTIVWAAGIAPTMPIAPGAAMVVNLVTYDGVTWYGEVQMASSPSLQASNNLLDVASQQTALNNLAGGTSSGQFLRGNGTNVQMSAIQTADVPQLTNYAPSGLTGATAASRYVGATTSGAPATGTFAVGDYVADQANGSFWVCVTAGSPGTWSQIMTTANDYSYNQNLASGETVIPRVPGPGTGPALVSGTMMLSYWTAIKTETVTKILAGSASTAAGATPTYCAMGIYSVAANGNLTLVGQCASDTTLFAATFTSYSRSLTASFAKTAGQRYAFGILVVSAAAMPNLIGYNGTLAFASNAPRLSATLSGQATLPATVSAASLSNTSSMYFGAITP